MFSCDRVFTPEQQQKIHDAMNLLEKTAKEIEELKKENIRLVGEKMDLTEKLDKQVEEYNKVSKLLREYQDDEPEIVNDEEFNSYFSYIFSKQEKV